MVATGLETSTSPLCICQRIPVVENLNAKELKYCVFPLLRSKLHPEISYRIKLGEILAFTTHLSKIKLEFLLSTHCVVGAVGDTREAQIWSGPPAFYSLVVDAQRKMRGYQTDRSSPCHMVLNVQKIIWAFFFPPPLLGTASIGIHNGPEFV